MAEMKRLIENTTKVTMEFFVKNDAPVEGRVNDIITPHELATEYIGRFIDGDPNVIPQDVLDWLRDNVAMVRRVY